MTAPLLALADVEAAAGLAGHVADTPFLHSETLSQLTGAELRLKFANLQFTGSIKQRGGLIAVSAGNHAQGVAYHAGKLGIPATITGKL